MTRPVLVLLAALVLSAAGCGSGAEPGDGPTDGRTAGPSSATATPASPSDSPTVISRTPELDAVGVMGHSGATGVNSEGDGREVPENSWATGTNPAVNSIYLRLLARHPALRDHQVNVAINGSDVDSLMDQAESMLSHDPVPDLVLVQSIDNDIRCDGSDPENYATFEATLREVVAYLETTAPGIRIFFIHQWGSVAAYDAVLERIETGPDHMSDLGRCSTFRDGRRFPRGEAYLQSLSDAYYDRITRVCRAAENCATDRGALQDLRVEPSDLAPDLDHATISGHAKIAAYAWRALPRAWK